MKPRLERRLLSKTALHTLACVVMCVVLLAGCTAPEGNATPTSPAFVSTPLSAASPTPTAPPPPQAFSLVVLHSNDVAGELEPCG